MAIRAFVVMFLVFLCGIVGRSNVLGWRAFERHHTSKDMADFIRVCDF